MSQTDIFVSRANSRIQAKTRKYWTQVQDKRERVIGLAKSLFLSRGEHFVVIYLPIDDPRAVYNHVGWNVVLEKKVDCYAEHNQIYYSTRQLTKQEVDKLTIEPYFKKRWRKQ